MKKVIPSDAVLIPDSAERVFEGMIFNVYQWQQQLFDGSEYTFEMLKRTDTVSVICIADDKILVIDDEQPHLGSRKSFPGGRVDPGDATIEDAAKREVLEETGYAFDNWRLIKVHQPYRKVEWFVHVLLAWDVTYKQAPKLDAGEKITLEPVTLEDLKRLIADRTGYLGESVDIFEGITRLEDLIQLPAFTGQEVDR
jgi:ADP-ribose pyrophosphatase